MPRISEILLELDGAALQTSLEQRGDGIWRRRQCARGRQHNAKRRSSTSTAERPFRWTFEASP
jgi:hypothetical protein